MANTSSSVTKGKKMKNVIFIITMVFSIGCYDTDTDTDQDAGEVMDTDSEMDTNTDSDSDSSMNTDAAISVDTESESVDDTDNDAGVVSDSDMDTCYVGNFEIKTIEDLVSMQKYNCINGNVIVSQIGWLGGVYFETLDFGNIESVYGFVVIQNNAYLKHIKGNVKYAYYVIIENNCYLDVYEATYFINMSNCMWDDEEIEDPIGARNNHYMSNNNGTCLN
jgi:hypothetical protein